MKTEKNLESKIPAPLAPKKKPKSLRPMRSMVAVRSLKPTTAVATMIVKPEVMMEKN
jgi:hypothetical protein